MVVLDFFKIKDKKKFAIRTVFDIIIVVLFFMIFLEAQKCVCVSGIPYIDLKACNLSLDQLSTATDPTGSRLWGTINQTNITWITPYFDPSEYNMSALEKSGLL